MSSASESNTTVASFIEQFANYLNTSDAAAIRSGKSGQINLSDVRITPQRAEKMLDDMITVLQRKIDQDSVLDLAISMENETFDAAIDPMMFFVYEGRVYFAAGRHRAAAQVVTGMTFQYPVFIRMIDSYDEFVKAYRLTHGRRAANRSETNEMLLIQHTELDTKGKRNKLMAAVKCIILYDIDPSVPADVSDAESDMRVAEIAENYMAPGQRVMDLVFSRNTHGMVKKRFTAPFLGAAIIAMKYMPQQTEALLLAARDTNHERNTAAYHLFKILTSPTTKYASGEAGRRPAYQDFLGLWEKHMSGEKFERLGAEMKKLAHLTGITVPKREKAQEKMKAAAANKKIVRVREITKKLEAAKQEARDTILPALVKRTALPNHLSRQSRA